MGTTFEDIVYCPPIKTLLFNPEIGVLRIHCPFSGP